jgi:hypothetical protein
MAVLQGDDLVALAEPQLEATADDELFPLCGPSSRRRETSPNRPRPPLNGTPIVMLIHGSDVRVIHAATGEVLRQLTINPDRRYHGTGKPNRGPSRPYGPRKSKKPEP